MSDKFYLNEIILHINSVKFINVYHIAIDMLNQRHFHIHVPGNG